MSIEVDCAHSRRSLRYLVFMLAVSSGLVIRPRLFGSQTFLSFIGCTHQSLIRTVVALVLVVGLSAV